MSGFQEPQISSSYTIFKEGSTFYAQNGDTGTIDYSGTDPTTVVNSAVGNLTSGGLVVLREGEYTLTGPINITNPYIWIRGTGYSTILKPALGNYALIVGDNVSEYANPKITDLYVQGQGSSYYGIKMQKVARPVLRSVKIENVNTGLYIYNCDNPRVYDTLRSQMCPAKWSN